MAESLVITVVVVLITELVKRLNIISKRYIPLVALFWGIIFTASFAGIVLDETLVRGVVTGLSAAGLYSCVKSMVLEMVKKL